MDLLKKKFDALFQRNKTVKETHRRQRIREWRKEIDAVISSLEEEFDPLVARGVFNVRHSSKLYQLPDEIWLQIIGHVSPNRQSFFMLRQVCRRFRVLMEGHEFRDHRFTSHHDCDRVHCDGRETFCPGSGFVPGLPFPFGSRPRYRLPLTRGWLQDRVGELLHIDTLCMRCSKLVWLNQQHNSRCKFWEEGQHGRCHDGTSGPLPKHLYHGFRRRSCIGTRGFVRLCEHKTIKWKEVKKHLVECRKVIEDDGSLQSYGVVVKQCNHPSHQTARCDEATGPKCTLVLIKSGAYVLNLEWSPHSGIGAFPSYQHGQFKASEMRDKFRQYRREGAGLIVPEMAPGQLPEMTCFPLGECTCLSYGSNEETEMVLYGSQKDSICRDMNNNPDHRPLWSREGFHLSKVHNGFCRSQVQIDRCPSEQEEMGTSPCIVTKYHRFIEGCYFASEKYPKVSHAWLHAMDRSSYFWGNRELMAMETCSTPGCRNSYSMGVYGCYERPYDMLWTALGTA
uniref:F-box domain-containing protein n=1 Tax=Bionectria ochroleuca TaxID=29856 RepID=A0A8H7NR29_BIOOC